MLSKSYLLRYNVPEDCDGVSLATTLYTGVEPESKPVFSEFTLGSFDIRHEDRLVMVRTGQRKFSLCLHPKLGITDCVLYHLTSDPYERRNLYGRSEYKEISDELTRLIREHLNLSSA